MIFITILFFTFFSSTNETVTLDTLLFYTFINLFFIIFWYEFLCYLTYTSYIINIFFQFICYLFNRFVFTERPAETLLFYQSVYHNCDYNTYILSPLFLGVLISIYLYFSLVFSVCSFLWYGFSTLFQLVNFRHYIVIFFLQQYRPFGG